MEQREAKETFPCPNCYKSYETPCNYYTKIPGIIHLYGVC